MGESVIVKSGEVSVQVKSLLKSSWVKKFCTLHRNKPENHAYMEIYEDRQAFEDHRLKSKKCDVKRIELQNVKSIRSSSENTSKGMEYHMEIRLKFQKHCLMFKREAEFTDWLTKLNSVVDVFDTDSKDGSASYSGDVEDSDESDGDNEVISLNPMYGSADEVQRFEVEVDPSDLAKICGIEGIMTLLVGRNDLAFEDPKTKQMKYSFQLAWMRRFGKYKSQSFNFEVGRKCPNGEGTINCKTASAKALHKIVTQKSSCRSEIVIPHPHSVHEQSTESKPKSPSVSVSEAPPLIKERQPNSNICEPTFANNLVRKHPGKANTPNLIPIVRPKSEDEKVKTPPQPARRGSKGKMHTNDSENRSVEKKHSSLQTDGHIRPQSYRTAVNSGEFAKELEQKLHLGVEEPSNQDTGKSHDIGKKDSTKTKEDKKREKEEKKEKERREKEEKKEKERKDKEMEKERKLREKEEKKSGKKDKQKQSHKNLEKQKSVDLSTKERIYDEPEISNSTPDDLCATYDEVSNPVLSKTFSSKKRAVSNKDEDLYEEASSSTAAHSAMEKVEYAEPYSKKGGVPLQQQPALYADVKSVEKDAWRKLGRKEEEECFEEDYSKIKQVREQVKKQTPPPIPAKHYTEDDMDEDLYNRVDLKHPKSSTNSKPEKPENLYGMASATEVGELPKDLVLIPERDYSSESGESLQEEGMYEEAGYEGYQTPSDVLKNSKKEMAVEATYEEAVLPVIPKTNPPNSATSKPSVSIKPNPPKKSEKKVRPKETLYEEIS